MENEKKKLKKASREKKVLKLLIACTVPSTEKV